MEHKKIRPNDPESFPPHWSDFERIVSSLLAFSGFEVTAELQLGSKKVDIVASVPQFGKTKTYAVECKAYAAKLTVDQVVNIEVGYQTLREANLIDELLLITYHGVAPSAEARIRESRFLSHQTLDELRASIIDFRSYCQDIQSAYTEEGLHRYYVPIQTDRGGRHSDLMEYCLAWISDSTAPPLALLGGYGTGKTTFLLHLANMLATQFQSGESSRIPIYIPLHELCSEQSLEGLLGRHFTGLHTVPRYSFGTFRQLNEMGTFVLLLDGFDEMKHSMTTAEFRFTFQEVLRLVNRRAKTVISGRPTAFLTDAEREEFLHASITTRGRVHSLQNQPNFLELELAPFSELQIREFVEKYRKYLAAMPVRDVARRIPDAEEFFQSANIVELARRPVQLRMLFDVLPSYEKDLTELTVRELYAFFVSLLLERESRKPARRNFSGVERKSFVECIAFLMWARRVTSIGIEDIPEECLPEKVEVENIRDAKRDLVSGALLEMRYPAQLFFPHRSIQEFLVSEYLLAYFRGDPHAIRLEPVHPEPVHFGFIEEYISPEVIDFMVASAGRAEFVGGLAALALTPTPLSNKTLRFWLQSETALRELIEPVRAGNLWALSLLVGARRNGWTLDPSTRDQIFLATTELLGNSQGETTCFGTLFLTWMLCSLEEDALEGHRRLQEAWLAVLRITERRTLRDGTNKLSGFVRPPYIVSLLQRVTSDFRTVDARVESKTASDRWWERADSLRMDLAMGVLGRACSQQLRVLGWLEAARPQSTSYSFNRTERLIEKIPVTETMHNLLLERFDEDMLASSSRKRRRRK